MERSGLGAALSGRRLEANDKDKRYCLQRANQPGSRLPDLSQQQMRTGMRVDDKSWGQGNGTC
ncbi:hypothetical protein K449DRAFT_391311 [Hypoxylon sp. EC38]|nr:hypothetical protein K449DRAFT_391311 [Hypoxylon sp. EC38]